MKHFENYFPHNNFNAVIEKQRKFREKELLVS